MLRGGRALPGPSKLVSGQVWSGLQACQVWCSASANQVPLTDPAVPKPPTPTGAPVPVRYSAIAGPSGLVAVLHFPQAPGSLPSLPAASLPTRGDRAMDSRPASRCTTEPPATLQLLALTLRYVPAHGARRTAWTSFQAHVGERCVSLFCRTHASHATHVPHALYRKPAARSTQHAPRGVGLQAPHDEETIIQWVQRYNGTTVPTLGTILGLGPCCPQAKTKNEHRT